MDIRKIAMFLAGRLPPYYGDSNLYSFTKVLRNFAPKEFTNNEMLFIQTQARGVDEEIYFMVLDDLLKTYNNNDIIKILRLLNIPEDLIADINGITLF